MTSATTDRRLGLTGNTGMKSPVDCATTANITLSGEQTIDGVTTSSSRVLVKNQTNAVENGIYKTGSGAWTRDIDANGNYDWKTGTLVPIAGGTSLAFSIYQLTTTGTITVDSSSLNFSVAFTAQAVSAYIQTLLNDADAAEARTTLGVAPRATRIDIASVAGTVDLTTNAPNTDDIRLTGSSAITGFTVAVGRVFRVVSNGTATLTNNSNIVTNTGANIVLAVGDTFQLRATAADTVEVLNFVPISLLTTEANTQLQEISGTPSGGALTITLEPTTLDFRSATLASGAVSTVAVANAISTVISSGSTGGTTSGVESNIVVAAINNAGTVELAWCNLAGGLDLSETALISTTAEGGAGAADSATTWYSTTARSNVAYRVVGILRSTQATAGTWATTPSLTQGAGGMALLHQGLKLRNPVATTSGTSIDFTSIPSFVKRITMMFEGVSTNGTASHRIRLGTGGSPTTSGYGSVGTRVYTTVSATSSSAGFDIPWDNAAFTSGGAVTFTKLTGNTWVCSGIVSSTTSTVMSIQLSGSVTLAGTLDMIQLTTSNGTDTFDAGNVNITYE